MKRTTKVFLGILFLGNILYAQKQTNKTTVPRPKLVVGIVVDQMRWDYLYRYNSKFGNDGFKRMLGKGFSCNNVTIDYIPSYTAVGHTTIFTGSVPSIDGIAGNDWIERSTGKSVYCTDDETVNTVGSTSKAGKMSPRNLWVTTVTDQLRLATNFQSKVLGVSLKDRASILPAGHNPTGAFWFDDATGNFITSDYYMKELPEWVNRFNEQKYPEKLLANGWNTLLPIDQYTESSEDKNNWENDLGTAPAVFPYTHLLEDYQKKKGLIRVTPFGNELTFKMANAAIEAYNMGKNESTDFLTINCASTDYAGHAFGPNSVEVEDVYLRLDQELAKFFKYLDQKVGRGQYTIFLTADHGGAHAKGFMEAHKMPTGIIGENLKKDLNQLLADQFGVKDLVQDTENYQIFFNRRNIADNKLDQNALKQSVLKYLKQQPEVLYAVDLEDAQSAVVPAIIKNKMINGYNRERSGDIQVIAKDNYLPDYAKKGTTHGTWNSYDAHIPLLFMGWGIKHGESNQEYHMTDIAPTLSSLLKIEFPSGNIGKPITEVIGK